MVMRIDTPPVKKRSISLTPLIDVVFILLIFFMLVSSFVQWRGVEVSVGQASEEVRPDQPNLVVIEIASDGGWSHKGQSVEYAALIQQLQDSRAAGQEPDIFLQPLRGSRVQPLVDSLDMLREQGFVKVGLVKSEN